MNREIAGIMRLKENKPRADLPGNFRGVCPAPEAARKRAAENELYGVNRRRVIGRKQCSGVI